MHFNLEMVGLVLAFTIPAIAEPVIYTSGITGSAHPRITPAPQVNDALAPQVAGPLTISVTNSFGR